MKITITDVARKANVSVATVSRAINTPEKVSETTLKCVRKVIKELNYTPNNIARSLVKKETKTIGVIVPDINNLFFQAVVRGIQDAAALAGYQAFFCSTDNDIDEEKRYIKSLIEKRVDAFIIMGSRTINPKDSEHIVELSEEHPTVLINDYIMGSNVYSVLTDEVEGAYKAVRHLISLGHKDIYHITVEPNFTTFVNKNQGYAIALEEFGIGYDEEKVINAQSYPESGKKAMDNILKSSRRPTAIFAGNDQVAIGVITSILNAGLRVPEDISVVGYSDIPIAKSIYPSLTTVGQFPHKTGQLAVDLAIKLINKEEVIQKKIVLKPDFIVRESTSFATNKIVE